MPTDTLDLFKQLADRFGVGVDYLWPLLVSYTRWLSVAWLAIDLVLISIAVFLLTLNFPNLSKHINLYHNRDSKEYIDYTYHTVWATLHGLVMLVSLFCLLVSIGDIPGRFAGIATPEIKAIYDLLAQIKK